MVRFLSEAVNHKASLTPTNLWVRTLGCSEARSTGGAFGNGSGFRPNASPRLSGRTHPLRWGRVLSLGAGDGSADGDEALTTLGE
jgi:hypothetical protein